MKILVCGNRNWTDLETIASTLEGFPQSTVTIIHGGCRGADMMAGEVAKELGWQVREYPARWDEDGKKAGPLRNQMMLDREHKHNDPIDICIAFHDDLDGSRGTADMVSRAGKTGIGVLNVRSKRHDR